MAQMLPQGPDQIRQGQMDLALNSLYLFQGLWSTNGNAPSRQWTEAGIPPLAVTGNDTAFTNGTIYYCEFIPKANKLLTGLGFLIGSIGGTDKAILSLHDANGNLLGNTAVAGVTVGTAANIQQIPLVAGVTVYAFTRYYIGLTGNGTTAKFRTAAIPGDALLAGSATQTFGTPASFAPAGTFTVNTGPFAFAY